MIFAVERINLKSHLLHRLLEAVILGFHSHDKQPCFLTETKKRICIKIEFNSRRINWDSNMAVVSSFRGSNMAAVTSGENQELNIAKQKGFRGVNCVLSLYLQKKKYSLDIVLAYQIVQI